MSISISSKSVAMTTPKVSAFQLCSGTTIIGQIVHDGKDDYLVLNPLELRIGINDDGIATFQFIKWMPFNKTGIVLIHKANIEGTSITSPDFAKYYMFQVKKYAFIQERLERSMAENQNEDRYEESGEPFEDEEDFEDSSANKTLH